MNFVAVIVLLLIVFYACLLWRKNKRVGFKFMQALCIGLVLNLILIGGWAWYNHRKAGQDLLKLLNGSQDIHITKFEITGQQRAVICSDKALCDYMAKMLRNPGPYNNLGTSYTFRLMFSTGYSYTVICAGIADDGFGFSLPEANPPELGLPTHIFYFREPIPPDLKKAWNFLKLPDTEEVRGKVLTLE